MLDSTSGSVAKPQMQHGDGGERHQVVRSGDDVKFGALLLPRGQCANKSTKLRNATNRGSQLHERRFGCEFGELPAVGLMSAIGTTPAAFPN